MFADQSPSIITLDSSSLRLLPNHTCKIINGLIKDHINQNLITKYDIFNALLYSIALEVGFIQNCDQFGSIATYSLNSSYSVDRHILEDFAQMTDYKCGNLYNKFEFNFINKLDSKCLVVTVECGDMVLITSHNLINNSIKGGYSTTICISRHVISRIDNSNLAKSFRNLRELSIVLKNLIFLPLRNEIYQEMACINPSLLGLPGSTIRIVLQFLNQKDLISLSYVCKKIRENCVSYKIYNKNKN